MFLNFTASSKRQTLIGATAATISLLRPIYKKMTTIISRTIDRKVLYIYIIVSRDKRKNLVFIRKTRLICQKCLKKIIIVNLFIYSVSIKISC